MMGREFGDRYDREFNAGVHQTSQAGAQNLDRSRSRESTEGVTASEVRPLVALEDLPNVPKTPTGAEAPGVERTVDLTNQDFREHGMLVQNTLVPPPPMVHPVERPPRVRVAGGPQYRPVFDLLTAAGSQSPAIHYAHGTTTPPAKMFVVGDGPPIPS